MDKTKKKIAMMVMMVMPILTVINQSYQAQTRSFCVS
jgi:accessory gene regulator protein AgrB